MTLPEFRFHPGAAEDGTIVASEETCAGCDRTRGFIVSSLLYSADVPGGARFCPWCVADGTAVARFGGTFNDVEPGAAEASAAEVEQRTPSFPTWQDWDWPVHCGEPASYRGQPTAAELRADPEARAALEDFDDALLDGLGGGVVAYRFACSRCGASVMRWDAD